MISRMNTETQNMGVDGGVMKQNQESAARKRRGFLRLPQVLEIFPVSKSTWWKGIKEGRFPKPVKLTERTSAWLLDDIEALCDRMAPSGVEQKTNEGESV